MTPHPRNDTRISRVGPADPGALDRRHPDAEARRAPFAVGRPLILKLDLCRGLLAFLVVAAHALDVCWVIHPEGLGALPASARHYLEITVQAGIYWVMGFFVISGYCIQLSVGRLPDSGRFPLFAYLVARASRIMPLYYIGLAFALAVEVAVAPARPAYFPDGLDHVGWLSQLFFVQRPFQTFGTYAPTWSISHELFYYAVFGILATLAPRHRAGPAWLGIALSATVGGTILVLYRLGYRNWYTLQAGLFFGLGVNWFLGALAAVHGPSIVRHRAVRVVAAAWPLALLGAVAVRSLDALPLQLIYLLLGLAFTMMILRFQASDARDAASPPAIPGWLAKLGEVVGLASYPTYLFHGPLLLLLASMIARSGVGPDWRASWVVLVASGIATGTALGWWLERPIMAWRAGLLRRLREPSIGRPAATAPILDARS